MRLAGGLPRLASSRSAASNCKGGGKPPLQKDWRGTRRSGGRAQKKRARSLQIVPGQRVTKILLRNWRCLRHLQLGFGQRADEVGFNSRLGRVAHRGQFADE